MYHAFDSGEGDEEQAEKMRGFMMSPSQVDQQIRQAIQLMWMILPKEKRNVDEIEAQVRRLVDRALRDLHDDYDNFFKTSS